MKLEAWLKLKPQRCDVIIGAEEGRGTHLHDFKKNS
jgi:hypothetical protein